MPKKTPVVEDWLNHEFSTGGYAGKDYLDFQRAAKRDLKKIAQSAGFQMHSFSPNHYCFSAVLRQESSGAFAYVSVSDVRSGGRVWYNRVLYRTMRHEKDWTGGFKKLWAWNEVAEALTRGYLWRKEGDEMDEPARPLEPPEEKIFD